MKLSLIIATYNRADDVCVTLKSVAEQSADPCDWECVVVNNNSRDNTIERVESFIAHNLDLNIRVVTETNQGLSHARNRGISESSAHIIAIIDDDEIIVPEFISAYISFFESHPEVAAAGGAIVPRYRSVRPKWMSHYTELPVANPLDLGDVICPFPKSRIPGGGNMALRRSALDKYGVFDPELGRRGELLIGGEENNLFERLKQGGEQIWWVPRAVMYHLIPDSKLTRNYLDKLWFNIGRSHTARAKIEGVSQRSIVAMEMVKWLATLLLVVKYIFIGKASAAHYLILMRYYISKGISSKL